MIARSKTKPVSKLLIGSARVGSVGAPGASSHLRQQLESALGCAEIGQVEADVRGDDTDQLDAREVMPLGDHLRADHDVDFFVLEGAQHAFGMSAPASHIAIESHRTRARKEVSNLFF